MNYDVAVIGGGPAGLSAGIFSARAGLKTVCFEQLAIGGQAALSYKIDNYPGCLEISGYELTNKMFEHASKFNVEFLYEKIVSLAKENGIFKITTNNNCYYAKKVIVATGRKTRKLNLDLEDKFTGKGISYCASCDGGFFKNKVVAVVGGGDTAMEDAEYLSRIAKKVYVFNRSGKFKAKTYRLNEIKKLKNVSIITNTEVTKLFGKDNLEKIEIRTNGKIKNIKIDGMFEAIGYEPDVSFIKFKVKKDKFGYLVVDSNQQTSQKNLYACGDITNNKFKQVITACSEGATAGNSCVEVN